MPSFHCERTSSQEYKWNSTSCPEGVPRKKKGISAAKAAVAIDISGAQAKLLRRASRAMFLASLTATLLEPSSFPDFMFAASFAPHQPARPVAVSRRVHVRTRAKTVHGAYPRDLSAGENWTS